VGIETRGDESPDLVEDVGQGDQESDHQRHFHRHQENTDHVGGNHLATLRQFRQQGLRQQRIEFLGPGEETNEDNADGDQRAYQTVTQLDQVREE
jgi:hypothetical protein